MADTELEKIFVDLIRTELELPNDYGAEDPKDSNSSVIPSVLIGFQNIGQGNTKKLQVTITDTPGTTIANNNYSDFSGAIPIEIQEVVQSENIQIDLFSRNTDARTRRWEIVAALNSIYSKQLQETNNFKIFTIPNSFVNTSGAEGGSDINRFTIVITCHIWYRKTKTITNYYDDFTGRVDNDDTIVPTWIVSNTYDTNDEIYYDVDQKYYRCLNNGVTSVPTTAADWLEIAEPAPLINL